LKRLFVFKAQVVVRLYATKFYSKTKHVLALGLNTFGHFRKVGIFSDTLA
jgi:hypothetical protein